MTTMPTINMSLTWTLTSFFFFFFSGSVIGKECTNIPTVLSHTDRSLSQSKYSPELSSRRHLNHEEESTWMDLLRREKNKDGDPTDEIDWAVMYRNVRRRGTGEVESLREFSLHDVRLDPESESESGFWSAQRTNLDYLLILDVDRLVWSFRNQAGLVSHGSPYGGWEAPDVELRGHFVGHYLSASAKMWASTHNDTLREKMTAVVDVLHECQEKMGTGYLSAFPPEFFDRLEAIESVWAPYYTIHKIMAGLLDQYKFADSNKALKMVIWMAQYFGDRIRNVIKEHSIERHWLSLNEENGGMNEVLYDLYSITGNHTHLVLAHLFDKPCFLGMLALQADSLSDFHANTHIPIVVGAQKRYEITGDPLYKEIGTYFMDTVNASHIYATGGTSVSEFWSDPKRLADTLGTENEESCTTYNLLKVSRNLFKWTKEMAYADHYERALTNGILSIQRGKEPGVMIYMLPLGRGVSKAKSFHGWGTKFDTFWCCYGTGIESFSKLGDSIYFEENGDKQGLYIVQFISSTLNWKSGGIKLNQKVQPVVSSDPYLRVSITFPSAEATTKVSTLNIRVPFWTSLDGAKASLNGQSLMIPAPGSFLSVSKSWTSNDTILLRFPIGLRTEKIRDDRQQYESVQAILFGPYLLAGLSSGDWEINSGNPNSIHSWIKPIPSEFDSQLISLAQESDDRTLFLTKGNNTLKMDVKPDAGTDAAIHATFRLIYTKNSTYSQEVMLEPFDLPGARVTHQGPNKGLKISMRKGRKASLFNLIVESRENPKVISLESVTHPGCFVYSNSTPGRNNNEVQLVCAEEKAVNSKDKAQFSIVQGVRRYNPISFMAKGTRRNFVLEPLLRIRDESYTAYFNITDGNATAASHPNVTVRDAAAASHLDFTAGAAAQYQIAGGGSSLSAAYIITLASLSLLFNLFFISY